ncbi:hypothetical protein KDL45_01430, partial [bacterium]|nr:hypothetical protein [bacterium]
MGIFQIGRTAYAAPEWETVSAGSAEWALHAVADDAAMGLLDRDTAAIYRAYALFAPSKLPSRYQPATNADADVESGHAPCWTAALNELRVAYAELTPYAREEIDRVAPSYIGLATHYRGGFATPTLPDDSAILARDNFGDTGGLKVPHVHYTDHFAIRWGSSFEFADTSITVEDLGEYLEDAWDLFVNDQGYARPYQSNDYYLDVYVGNSGSGSPGIGGGAAAYVTFYDVSSRDIFDSMNYMVIQKGVFSYGDYTREVVGHEFYHMIQFGAGIAHDCYDYMYTAASEGSAWAAEASAVWAEDEASPDSNFWVGFVSEAQNYPELSIMYFGGSLHYGRSLFFDYIDERHGGEEAIYALWNECHASILDSADALLRDQGTSLHAMFPKYALANFFGDYLEGDLFPTAPLHTQFDDYPLEFVAGEDLGDDVPENFAANYLRFAPDSGNQLSFHIEGADRVGGR